MRWAVFLDHIKTVEDHRIPGMTTYPLDEVLLTVLVGLLCRMGDFDANAMFTHAILPKGKWIHRPLRLPPPPFGRASPPPQLCGPMSSSVGLRGLVEGRFAARPKGRSPA